MASCTQFASLFEQRVAALCRSTSATERRWRIWLQQEREGLDICFATSARDTCKELACPRRDDCLGLHADWRR